MPGKTESAIVLNLVALEVPKAGRAWHLAI